MHEDAVRGICGLKVSPRGQGLQGSSPTGSSVGVKTAVSRRSSSHFREIPVNVIPENSNATDEDDSSEEEKK